ncbi:MAG TPA: beta-N-acetylglucosaminidase domain-containing protein [Candidatus Polarisedimenticolaceae bacterium]|nr:beta-N-acetylglucosaminidase domain-containing protein [Candidatus Polarisedimenticolaceae bacterium]
MHRWIAAALLAAWALAARADGPVRMVKLGALADDPRTQAHVANARSLGFNALWLYTYQAGRWTEAEAPQGPSLSRPFLRLARECRKTGTELWVSVNPVEEMKERFVFAGESGERGVRAIVAFAKLLRKKGGVRHFVLSFDDQPINLAELSDIFTYGLSAAPAHLDLVRRVRAALPADIDLWMCPSTYCDAHLGDGTTPYAKAFLSGLSSVPESVGIIWTGPRVVSPSITRADLAATRARLGGRRLFLYDNFPGEGGGPDGLALVLGALRNRDPELVREIQAYLALPMDLLGASRLPLATQADFLRDPAAYDPDASVARAIARLAGGNREAADALTTQQLEWGGWVGGRNYWTWFDMSAEVVAERLGDPAFVESFTWTVARYPGRMRALEGLADVPFRDDLLLVMARRLAVARALPLTIEYLARVRAGRADASEVLAQIDRERASWAHAPDTAHVLDIFLATAGVPTGTPR